MSGKIVKVMPSDEHYFGVCPTCRQTDGYINLGMGHWFYCSQHQVRWYVGSNLFSSCQHETEQEQRKTFDELDFGSYEQIKQWHSPEWIAAKKESR